MPPERERFSSVAGSFKTSTALSPTRSTGSLPRSTAVTWRAFGLLNYVTFCRLAPETRTVEEAAANIAREAALDGIYVIRTSVPAAEITAEDAVALARDGQLVDAKTVIGLLLAAPHLGL